MLFALLGSFHIMTTCAQRELARDRRAIMSLEYGIIAAVVAIAIITTMTMVGTSLHHAFLLLHAVL